MADKCSPTFLLAMLFSVSAVGLQIAWYVIVPFIVLPETMSVSYAFEPASTGAYQRWGVAMLVLVPIFVVWTISGACVSSDRIGQLMLIVSAVFYAIMIIIGHAIGPADTNERRADVASFATQFNGVYCSARTFEACVQGNELDVLALTGRTNTTTTSVLRDGESVSDAAFSIWTRCIDARVQSIQRLGNAGPEGGEYTVAPDYRLLDDCSSSREVDAWCGRYELMNATLPVAEHLTLPSPFAANPHVFASYVDEWPRRMRYTDVLLGTAVGSAVLAALSCKAIE